MHAFQTVVLITVERNRWAARRQKFTQASILASRRGLVLSLSHSRTTDTPGPLSHCTSSTSSVHDHHPEFMILLVSSSQRKISRP
nr:hypothetical protein CFP56_67016 [Quercus suber]